MDIHREDQSVRLIDRSGEAFIARVTHVEEQGKHTCVMAADQENMGRLQNMRGEITAKLKEDHGIRNNTDLNYIEQHPNGALYQVNVDHIGRGPGLHGEPEHLKNEGKWLGEDQVKAALGPANLPNTPKHDINLNQSDNTKLSHAQLREEQRQERQAEKQAQAQDTTQKQTIKM